VLGYHVVEGCLRDFEKAFQVKFLYYDLASARHRSHKGAARPPSEVADIVTGTLGFDNRSMAVPHMHHPSGWTTGTEVQPSEVARTYKYPADKYGSGQTIAIIELDGGFYSADIRTQFKTQYKIAPPKISVISIHGQRNSPAKRKDVLKYLDALAALMKPGSQAPSGTLSGDSGLDEQIRWTIETSLDVQLAGALAPGARLKVLFAPNHSHGKFHALASALRDPKVSVVSCSWGAREDSTSEDFVQAWEGLLMKAALLGVTVCCSSGDDFLNKWDLHLYYPSSSPHLLSCGGTHLHGGIEEAWNEEIIPRVRVASTGGASRVFRTPSWQGSLVLRATGKNGRGVPDVAAKADLRDGYSITVAGRQIPMGGTSAAAPAWAALIARINEKSGLRIGYITQLLYSKALRGACRDIRKGTNGVYSARAGWDACTGLGSPVGDTLLLQLCR
jgi:kumamolisin